jgi:MoxR-like ATPase
MSTLDDILQLKQRMAEAIIGQEQVIERLLLTLLANGNLLLEGLPGLAKTRAVKSLARHLESEFRPIQFTPDLLPSDVTGTKVYYDEGGKGSFHFQSRQLFISDTLLQEDIALEESGDGVWSIYFYDMLLARLDERDFKLYV